MVRLIKQVSGDYKFWYLVKGHRREDCVSLWPTNVSSNSFHALMRIRELLHPGCKRMGHIITRELPDDSAVFSVESFPRLYEAKYFAAILSDYKVPELAKEIREKTGLYVNYRYSESGSDTTYLIMK